MQNNYATPKSYCLDPLSGLNRDNHYGTIDLNRLKKKAYHDDSWTHHGSGRYTKIAPIALEYPVLFSIENVIRKILFLK